MNKNTKKNIKDNKENKNDIKYFLTEIDNKKLFLTSFKKRYINSNSNNFKLNKNQNKSDTIILKKNALNNIIKEFEAIIHLSLQIILYFQDELKYNNNKISINLKNNKENLIKKINNSYNSIPIKRNINDNNNMSNVEFNPKSKRVLLKSYTMRDKDKNIINDKIKFNFNKINNNESSQLNNNIYNNKSDLQTNNIPYHLFLKNQLDTLNKNIKNKSNFLHRQQNSYINNFPSLKQRTLQTLYSNTNIDFSQDKDKNNYNSYNQFFKENNNSFSESGNYRGGIDTNVIKPKTPIRRALRALIKAKKSFNNSYNQIRNKNFENINYILENNDDLIKKINESEEYKLYFSEKYGDGNYFNFLNKYKKGEINNKDINNEFKIISNVLKLKESKNQNYYNDYMKNI